MIIDTIFFDLDGTLYPHNNGMWSIISDNMNQYIKDYINIPEDQISTLREKYFQDYGTTLRGLQENHNINTELYLEIVHNVPLENFLKIDYKLDEILSSLPQDKWIFTNSDFQHSKRVLQALGIDKHFKGIIDVWATDFHPKPTIFSFEKALEISGAKFSENCLFVDDIPKNLVAAKNIGIKTVLVGNNLQNNISDYQIDVIHDLLDEIPSLVTG